MPRQIGNGSVSGTLLENADSHQLELSRLSGAFAFGGDRGVGQPNSPRTSFPKGSCPESAENLNVGREEPVAVRLAP